MSLMATNKTWCHDNGLACWKYQIETTGASRWSGVLLTALPDLLQGFAHAAAVEVSTCSHGEEAFVGDLRAPEGQRSLTKFVEANQDIEDIDIDLNLALVIPQEGEFEIRYGANLTVEFEKENASRMGAAASQMVTVTLWLNVDVYAPLSWGLERDNRVLAKANAPRLRGVLERLEQLVGRGPCTIEAPDYPRMVDRYGFIQLAE